MMKPFIGWTLLTLATFFVLPCHSIAEEATEIERLQGHWLAVSGEVDGKPLAQSELLGVSIVVEGKHIKHKPSGYLIMVEMDNANDEPTEIDTSNTLYKFDVSSTKTPKEIDIEVGWSGTQISTPWGTWRRGQPILEKSIYSLKGNKLTICWGGDVRPTAFDTNPGDGFSLIVYELAESEKDVESGTP